MNSKPKTIASVTMHDVMRQVPADIPASSPYYDRLRALNDEICFTAESSPHYKYLVRQIAEMEERAKKRIDADRRYGITLNKTTL